MTFPYKDDSFGVLLILFRAHICNAISLVTIFQAREYMQMYLRRAVLKPVRQYKSQYLVTESSEQEGHMSQR